MMYRISLLFVENVPCYCLMLIKLDVEYIGTLCTIFIIFFINLNLKYTIYI